VKNEIRIVGGRFRSRKLRFPAAPGLRPTPDRVRETLFNWLRNDIEGARCLDLYAGSGALGFEAASRGAALVVQVERDAAVCEALERNRALLNAEAVNVVQAEVGRFLAGPGQPFDVVFLDPPFHRGLVVPCCLALEENGWLSSRAKIYLEAESVFRPDGLPQNWRALRGGKAGEVGYYLYERLSSGQFS